MKKNIILLLGILLIASSGSIAQDVEEDIYAEIAESEYSNNTEVHVKNINGQLKVVGYEGDEIIITGTKKLWKDYGSISSSESDEYTLEYTYENGNWYIYVLTPHTTVTWNNGRMSYRTHWNWDDRDRDRIDFAFDIELKVPRQLFVHASTINSGTLNISGIENGVDAKNVNGSIIVKEVAGVTDVSTVNGDIEVWFAESPTEDCEFETVNGTMKIYSPDDFGAVVTFKSLHGELYTDFDEVTRLAHQLNREESSDGFRYRISRTAPIQIGNGGPDISFESVNGSVYIRQRES